jgi:hypothetical protein
LIQEPFPNGKIMQELSFNEVALVDGGYINWFSVGVGITEGIINGGIGGFIIGGPGGAIIGGLGGAVVGGAAAGITSAIIGK